MAAPYPRRGPTQGIARAVNRGSKGQAQGRFAGLGAVPRPNGNATRVEPPDAATGGATSKATQQSNGTWTVSSGSLQDTLATWTVANSADLTTDGFGGWQVGPAGVYSGMLVVQITGLASGERVRLTAFSDAINNFSQESTAFSTTVAYFAMAIPAAPYTAGQYFGFSGMRAYFAGSAPSYSVQVWGARCS